MERINYDDKVALYENPDIADINKVNASDMNNIKSTINGALNGTNPMGSIVVDDISGKNKYNPSFRKSDGTLYCSSATGTENNGTYSLVASGTDMFMWQIRNANDSYTENQGQLYEFTDDTYTLTISNSAINKNFITYYNENKISLGYTQKNSNSFTFSKSDKTGAKYFSIRIGNGSATSGTTYSFTIQLEAGNTATDYTPYMQPVKKTSIGVKEDTTFYANDFKCRNLLPRKGSITINGITITEQSDGSLILNGTATNNVSYYYCGNDTTYLPFSGLEQGGTFTLSSTSASGYAIYILKSDGTVIASLSNGGSTTFTTSTNETYRIFIRINNSTALNNIHIYPQLEVGSEATPYTPYKSFENEEIYSTNEVKIGKWIDGKDLYKKTFEIAISSTGDYQYDVTSSGISNVVLFKGYCTLAGQTTPRPLPYVTWNSTANKMQVCDIEGFSSNKINCKTDFANSKIYLTIEYTKS